MAEEDLATVEFETSEDVEVIPTFDSMGLREDLLRLRETIGHLAGLNQTHHQGQYAKPGRF